MSLKSKCISADLNLPGIDNINYGNIVIAKLHSASAGETSQKALGGPNLTTQSTVKKNTDRRQSYV